MREKELRLALICYGGISLAVYMHGIAKEIWHLVRASRHYHDGTTPKSGSGRAYRALLQEIEDTTGVKLRVLTDIISGASAGGINGVLLGQAIVTGQSLEPLTRLWLDCADADVLIDPDARPVGRFSKFWAQPIAWAALRMGRTIDRTVSPEARDEVADKVSRFVRARWFAPPFGGKQFSKLLLDALGAMEKSERGPNLLPEGQPLDLFVTVTDYYGYAETLRLNSPPRVVETEHRLTISFSTRGQPAGHLASHASLVFAARATASFPGAFPPFRVDELDGQIAASGLTWPDRSAFLARILPNQTRMGTVEDTVLIDGSVLANAPFRQAIGAVRNRPARREVDRRFVYIDPQPGSAGFRIYPGRSKNDRRLPGFFTTLLASLSNIPREQPIRDSLEQIDGRSARISKMQAITAHLRPEIEDNIEDLLGKGVFQQSPTPRKLEQWRVRAQHRASKGAGFAYSAYAHLKLTGIAEEIVATLWLLNPGEDPGERGQLRDAVQDELLRRGLDRLTDDRTQGESEAAVEFFRRHDLLFRVRRLRFLARRLAEDVESRDIAPEESTERLHDAIYNALALCFERETPEFLGPELAAQVEVRPMDVGALIDALAERRGLVALDNAIDAILCDAFAALPRPALRSMMFAWLGFPLYDIATLPLMEGEAQHEFDPIKVDRIAPDDATSLRKGGAVATLKGIEFNSFGAFFCRAYRENDYLWGRLHGAERLIDIVNSSLPVQDRLSMGRCVMIKKRIFAAIVEEEAERLRAIQPLIAELRDDIAALSDVDCE